MNRQEMDQQISDILEQVRHRIVEQASHHQRVRWTSTCPLSHNSVRPREPLFRMGPRQCGHNGRAESSLA